MCSWYRLGSISYQRLSTILCSIPYMRSTVRIHSIGRCTRGMSQSVQLRATLMRGLLRRRELEAVPVPAAIPIALTIAGSDSSGGAGIQADLKTFSALGVYGCSVITALTAQTCTRGVQDIFEVNPDFVRQQLQSVFSDFNIKAVKVGMLHQSQIIKAVADAIEDYKPKYVVIDPVDIMSSRQDTLLYKGAIKTLKTELIPKATLITPNIEEAVILLGYKNIVGIDNDSMEKMMEPLLELGSKGVLLKGGHMTGYSQYAVDIYNDGRKSTVFELTRVDLDTRNKHDISCTFSSAITALLARGLPMEWSIDRAKFYVSGAIANADKVKISNVHGPVNHFWLPLSVVEKIMKRSN